MIVMAVEVAPGFKVGGMTVIGFAQLFDDRLSEFVNDRVEHDPQRFFLIEVQFSQSFAAAFEFSERQIVNFSAECADYSIDVSFGEDLGEALALMFDNRFSTQCLPVSLRTIRLGDRLEVVDVKHE